MVQPREPDDSIDLIELVTMLWSRKRNTGFTLNATNYVRTVTNAGATRPITVRLGEVPPGWPSVTFVVREAQPLRIDPDPRSRIVPGSAAPGKYPQSAEPGATLTLKRSSATEWTAAGRTGSWSPEP